MADITLVSVGIANPPTIPAGVLYVAAALEQAGHEVDFRDHSAKSYTQLDPSRFAVSLKGSASVIGISCTSDTLPFCLAALRAVKDEEPSKFLILGGPGPTGVAEAILMNFPFIDLVVLGEGEVTAVEVMECLNGRGPAGLGQVEGICYRDGPHVVVTKPRERIRELDSLPRPLYDRVDMDGFPLVNVVFSRGCPYSCSFCDVAPMWGRQNVKRSVGSVIAELRHLRQTYGKREFEFTDETFVLNKGQVAEFCKRLRAEKLDISWTCTGRVDLITEDLLKGMKSAGCKALFFGIESGSDRVLHLINKRFSVGQALEAVRLTRRHMHAVASFIWGFPFETREDLLRTLLLMVYMSQLGVDTRLNRLAPFALSPIYTQYAAELQWVEPDGHVSPVDPFQAGCLGEDMVDLIRRFPKVFPSFYRLPTDDLAGKTDLVRDLEHHWRVAEWMEMALVGEQDGQA
jgi:anaerobic magnesium-protoporphyrin IX monomethyl ester cyclase